MSEKESNGTRLREIISVIHKHQIARGVTPEKLRLILEDLGPTYIKLGQIMSMRSDIFPKKIFLKEFRKMKIADFTRKFYISQEFTVETDLIHRRHLSVPDSHRIIH